MKKTLALAAIFVFSLFAACSDNGTAKLAETCGNGTCDAAETVNSCAADCVDPNIAVCGNETCEDGETSDNCNSDCPKADPDPVAPVCGDTKCESPENATNCKADCEIIDEEPDPITPVCGNDVCENGEAASNCPADCSTPAVCGDSKCSLTENYGNCPADCPTPVACGNGTCETGETYDTCASDCPEIPKNFIGNIKNRFIEFMNPLGKPTIPEVTQRENMPMPPCLINSSEWKQIAFSQGTSTSFINDIESFNDKLYVARDDGLYFSPLPNKVTDCMELKKDTSLNIQRPITALTTTRLNKSENDLLLVGIASGPDNDAAILKLDVNGAWKQVSTCYPSLKSHELSSIDFLETFNATPYAGNASKIVKYTTNNDGACKWEEILSSGTDDSIVSIKPEYFMQSAADNGYTYSEFGMIIAKKSGEFGHAMQSYTPNPLENLKGQAPRDIDVVFDNSTPSKKMIMIAATTQGLWNYGSSTPHKIEKPAGSFDKLFVDQKEKIIFALNGLGTKIYQSNDFGTTWKEIIRENMPAESVSHIYYKDGILYIATIAPLKAGIYATKIK